MKITSLIKSASAWKVFGALAKILMVSVTLTSAASAEQPWQAGPATKSPAGQKLRGFGQVETEFSPYEKEQHRVWVMNFRCENAEKAGVLIGKFLADLGLSPNVEAIRISAGKSEIPAVTTASGAVFIGCVEGAKGRIVCSESKETVEAFLKTHSELIEGAVDKAAYPAYLDRFDRYGWGLYGLDGFQGDWMRDAAKFDGKKELKDPFEDFQWLARQQNRFEPHLEPAGYLGNADGIIANANDDWQIKLSRDFGLPVSFRLYGSAQPAYHGWISRRFGKYQNQPADFLPPRIGSYAVEMMQSWYAPDAHRYQAVKAMEMVQKYVNEPEVMGWMHPYGEIQTGTWEYDHGDYGPYAQASWHRYLQNHGCDLTEATRIYDRKLPFGDWDQVPIPEFALFAGLDGQVESLAGQWWSRQDISAEKKLDDAWWKKPAEERYQGVREKWWQGSPDGNEWSLVKAPGGGGLPQQFSLTCSTWFRRSFNLTPDQLKETPIYLYWFPISSELIHSGTNKRYHEVYLNGTKVGEIGSWGAVDVSRDLTGGENQIALHLFGSQWQGRIFLSKEEPKVFPALGDGKNRLWVLWRQWLVDSPVEAMTTVLEGMREADPNRPIKNMAPINLGSSRYVRLAHDYGMFPHFTGEGMWYFPWYKRSSYLYDVPASSETAGPAAADDPTCAGQFDAYRRVFMAGLNAHDPVFAAQTYSRSPYLRSWWEGHQPVLHQLGRYDLFGPQVLLFRSDLVDVHIVPQSPYPQIGASSRLIQTPWNWDLGRGTFQTLGQSYLYIDDRGVADGKMKGYRVMMDCGNEIMTEETRKNIADWVRTGGTFVALPFTGRDSLMKFDSWHIRELTGCGIGKLRAPGNGTVTIKASQDVFRICAGRSFPDKGSSMDWVGNELNQYSIELQPGEGSDYEVLATYENGQAAVVKRRLGQGSVITFGSVFWRNCRDVHGVWPPQSPEPEVIGDLLTGLGQLSLCETDGNLVWPQPYRSNNGLDWVTVLTSWNEDKNVTTTLRLRLPVKPAALVSFGVDGEKNLDFDWKDGVAETKVAMPAREVKVVRALGVADPMDSVSYWWNYQQRMWHELVKPTLDLAPYRRGQFADPTVDLRPDARFTNDKPADDEWMKPGFDDKKWKQSPLSIFRFWGAEPGKPLWVRKTFTVPQTWHEQPGQIRVVIIRGDSPYTDLATTSLNGVPVDPTGRGFADAYIDIDARTLLRDGQNVLAWEFKGQQPIQGFQGEVYLYHRGEPEKSIPLTIGEQMVTIPRSWQNKYRVMLYLEGERYTISSAKVNDHRLGRAAPYPAPAEYNLTAYLKFGEDNRIWVNPGKSPEATKVSRLDLFPIDE